MWHEKILIGVVLCFLLVCVYEYAQTQIRVSVPVGYRNWSVIKSYDNSAEAAKLLNDVNTKMIDFFRYLKKRYHIDETDDAIASDGFSHKTTDAYLIVQNILTKYNPDVFYENDPRYTKETSYTVNKGEAMYVCLRQKADPTKLMDIDTTVFVMLHEVSHIGCYSTWGHDDRFWTVFKFILEEAVAAGIYHPVDFRKEPKNYCGLKIEYQPLFDSSLPRIEGVL